MCNLIAEQPFHNRKSFIHADDFWFNDHDLQNRETFRIEKFSFI